MENVIVLLCFYSRIAYKNGLKNKKMICKY